MISQTSAPIRTFFSFFSLFQSWQVNVKILNARNSETEFTVLTPGGSGYEIDIATGVQDGFFTWIVNADAELVLTDDNLPDIGETVAGQEEDTILLLEGSTADLREAIETIARRSEGLMQFVARYRELLKIPQPVPATINVRAALESVVTLMADSLRDTDVTVDVSPESLEVRADPNLLDQLLLNILKNASDATSDVAAPELLLSANMEYGRVVIRISDNGPGISDSVVDQIFVPFFTTKRDGSGIGLSLSRQIMTAHRGEIAINRKVDKTIVSLVF